MAPEHTAPVTSVSDDERRFFHDAARRVAVAQIDRLSSTWTERTGAPVTDELRSAFTEIVWNCSGVTVTSLCTAFTPSP